MNRICFGSAQHKRWSRLLSVVVLFLALVSIAGAQVPSTPQDVLGTAASAPLNTSFTYKGRLTNASGSATNAPRDANEVADPFYPDYEDLLAQLQDLAADYSDIVSYQEIGRGYQIGFAQDQDDVPVTVTILRVDAFCDPEDSGQDFYAWVTIGEEDFSSRDDAGDDNNHIQPNWTFPHPGVDAGEPSLLITIRMREMDGGWPLDIDLDDTVDIHPDADKNGLTIYFDVASGEWVVDEGEPGPPDDQPYGHQGVWRGSNGVDCAEVEFDISSVGFGDTDGDGLLDNWELNGLDVDGDGTVDVDLPAMGARVDHKDIFVEVDWMQQPPGPANHSHEPWQAAWIPVWHAFNDAPVMNEDGTFGIKLHVDTGTLYSGGAGGLFDCDRDGNPTAGDMDCDGDGIIDIGNLGALGVGTPGGGGILPETQFLDFLNDGTPNDFYNVKRANFNSNRSQVFHYAIFAHSLNAGQPTTSGRAEIFGNDLIISLGGWGAGNVSPITGMNVFGQINQHAGTFMHELGHNLNLRHGGGDNDIYKPNYLSVMNYDHQMSGVLGLAVNSGLDYSPRALPPALDGALDEDDLDECIPLNDPRPLVVAQWTVDDNPAVQSSVAFGPDSFIDWNWDNNENVGTADDGVGCGNANIPVDLNYRDTGAIERKILQGHNDWSGGDLRLDFRHSEDFEDGLPGELVQEMTLAEELAIEANRPRVVELTSPDQFCPNATVVHFNDFPVGTIITNQYPGVHIIDNDDVDPKIAFRGADTASPPNSLLASPQAGPSSFGIPLWIAFDAPMYRVGMYIGNGGTLGAFSTLQAYDPAGELIGEVSDRIPESVTEFLGIYALEGGIKMVRLDYPISNAEEIDDLIFDFCADMPSDPTTPTDPFSYQVRSQYVTYNPMGENTDVVITPLEGVAVDVNGVIHNTTYTDEIVRGGTLDLQAPVWAFAPDGRLLAFAYWLQDEFLIFPEGQRSISVEVDHNTFLTAVYHLAQNTYLPLILKVWRADGPTPTPTATRTPTPTPTSGPTPTPTPTATQTPTPTPTSSPTPTPTPITVILTPIADAYISYAAPDTNYGTAPTLYVGKNETSIGRSLFQFDLSGIPAGSTVISAAFQAYLVALSTTPPSLDVELKRVDDPWTEPGVSWNTQPGSTGIGKVNGVGTVMGYYDWDVAGLVQDWIDGTANNGLALWSYTETTFGWRGFASRESASPSSPPRLAITYRP